MGSTAGLKWALGHRSESIVVLALALMASGCADLQGPGIDRDHLEVTCAAGPPISSEAAAVAAAGACLGPLAGDALEVPPEAEVRAAGVATGSMPSSWETSEFMAGKVAVGVYLPESRGCRPEDDGDCDESAEDWTDAQRAQVLEEITDGLAFWTELAKERHGMRLEFILDLGADGLPRTYDSRYEPIQHRGSFDSAWIVEGVAARAAELGDDSIAVGGSFSQVRALNNALRDEYGTDWAFTIFVVNSERDPDGFFASETSGYRYFAYAYLGGPWTVMTYDNDGYGIGNMDAVIAHEVGHIFRAQDQYAAAQTPCNSRSGYLQVENQNSEYHRDGAACTMNEESIMRGQTWPFARRLLDPYGAGQLGWRDSDEDGLIDVVDTGVDFAVDTSGDAYRLQIAASVTMKPFPSASSYSRSIAIGRLERVAVELDAESHPLNLGETPGQDYGFGLELPLSPGVHRLTIRAVTDHCAEAAWSAPVCAAACPAPPNEGLLVGQPSYVERRADDCSMRHPSDKIYLPWVTR